jgi:hypothetical protein
MLGMWGHFSPSALTNRKEGPNSGLGLEFGHFRPGTNVKPEL